MRIGYDAKRAFYNFTGLGNFARTLLTDLLRFEPDNQYLLFTPRVHRNETINEFLEDIDEAEIISPPHPMHRLWRSWGVSMTASKNGVQLYHGLSHELPRGLKRKNIRSVVTMHDIIYKIYPQYYTSIDRATYQSKSNHACKTADRIIAISESTKQDIIEEFKIPPDRIEVIYQSCGAHFRNFFDDLDENFDFRKKYDLPDRYILYVGSVIERKKLLETVQAVEQTYGETGLPLVVIGSGKNYMRRVYQYVLDQELEDRILFRENISYRDLPYLYYGAEVFIYPSEYEGFGIPVIESQYCATPVITSSLSSLPEVGGPNAFYLDEISSDNIASKIKKVLDSDWTREDRRAQYSEHLAKFDPENICRQHLKLYEACLGQ
ncbi:MAG TPA: glycosyltransferase family 1 protein [Saprospiraceae bacterium]|nr:glycosyltransferase family 1 protein [Saprospiraceae bacterium]